MITKREMKRLKELIQKITEVPDIKEVLSEITDRGIDMGLGEYWWE